MRKRNYDLILPFGEACHTAHTLKRLKYRTMSCPFDWMHGSDFEGRFNIILNRFENFFNKEDLIYNCVAAKCDEYKNTRTRLYFNHDFPQGVNFDEFYPIVAKKYERRISRVLEILNKKSSVLLLYIDLPTTKESVSNEKIKALFSQLETTYPKTKIDLLYIKHDARLKTKEVVFENLTNNITIAFCNNKSTDPNVPEWQANYENTKQALKLIGLKYYLVNYIQYRVNKFKVLFKQYKENKKQIKKYKHFISIGYNCENAYRFFQKYHFVESSLFSWANTKNIDTLLYALSNLDIIFKNTPQKVISMWECIDTKILFHGKEPYDMSINFSKYSEEDFMPYKEELISRVKYLKNKFLDQLRNNEKTLITYTYNPSSENSEEIAEKIVKLKGTLLDLGAKNFDLLIVLEKKYQFIHVNEKNVFLRFVDEFAPYKMVTTKHYDKKSWNKILKEFKADFKLKKSKKFKFENVS